MKYAVYIFILLIPVVAFAAPESIPQSSVWYTPVTAKHGEAIDINAFIYNSQSQDITFTVSFVGEKKNEITKSSALIPAETAKAVVGQWTMPKDMHTVTAIIVGATTKQKKEISSLYGDVGTIEIGSVKVETPKKTQIPIPSRSQITSFFSPYLSSLEAFRVKHAEIFLERRKQAEERAGVASLRTLNIDSTSQKNDVLEPAEQPKFVEYGKVVLNSSLSTLFNNKTLFYGACILLVLFVIRFIARRFI